MTGIQWTDQVWNPATGCDRTSTGCDHCYALTLAKRLKGMGQAKYQKDGDPRTSGPGFGLTMHPDTLDLPLRWRQPRRVFVNSMSDLFHDQVTDEFLARVFAVMAATPQHTYQVLTKRHGRMRSLLRSEHFRSDTHSRLIDLVQRMTWEPEFQWPLPNVWMGVSVEDQAAATLRTPALWETPAAVRFLSCEPLLGPLDLTPWLDPCKLCTDAMLDHQCDPPLLRWVIVGGESGPGARPCDPEWIRSLVKQCQAAGVPVFVKQLGSVWARDIGVDSKGGNPVYWPQDLRIREFPGGAS